MRSERSRQRGVPVKRTDRAIKVSGIGYRPNQVGNASEIGWIRNQSDDRARRRGEHNGGYMRRKRQGLGCKLLRWPDLTGASRRQRTCGDEFAHYRWAGGRLESCLQFWPRDLRDPRCIALCDREAHSDDHQVHMQMWIGIVICSALVFGEMSMRSSKFPESDACARQIQACVRTNETDAESVGLVEFRRGKLKRLVIATSQSERVREIVQKAGSN